MALGPDRYTVNKARWWTHLRKLATLLWLQATITGAIAIVTERQTPIQEGVVILDNLKFQKLYGSQSYGLFVNISIGFPLQEVTVQLNGGGLTWVPSSYTISDYNCRGSLDCDIIQSYGAYNPSLSTTTEAIDVIGAINTQVLVNGDLTYDTLSVGGIRIGGFPFMAAVIFSDVPPLGLGASPGSFGITKGSSGGTDDLRLEIKSLGTLQAIYDAQKIDVKGFAMYYDAYDTEKYEAPIVTYTQKTQQEVGRFNTRRVSFSKSPNDNQPIMFENLRTTIVIGDSNIRFPDILRESVLLALNATSSGLEWYVNCETAEKLNFSLDFEFDDRVNITLTAKDLIGRVEERAGVQKDLGCKVFLDTLEDDGEFIPGNPTTMYLGIPFMRVAYVWVDYQNNQTSIAKAKQRVANSNIVKIEEGGIKVTLEKDNVGRGPISNGTEEEPPPKGSDERKPRDENNKVPIAAIAGGLVGGIAVLGAIGYLLFVLWKKRRQQLPEIPPVPMEELDGHQKVELDTGHKTSELPDVGQEGYLRELSADYEQPRELSGRPTPAELS
ncbi:hypothetical protein TWF106_006094 [Orbilia oligospora]|uniref:Peptidase A1 domain-containing protein n=1 Tax=Orbilia oligospora TaxID=2813651 RepID=A0A7C8UTB3_ORBOL|nr:hypothetical protein TWF106_006094 [Orbilia oligospora]